MSRPAKVVEVYKRDERDTQGGSTSLDWIAAVTPIGGSASLDQQFGNGKNPFNVSATERFTQDQIHGGK